jgi:RimJ/RimL family protein N-acetyltransferase
VHCVDVNQPSLAAIDKLGFRLVDEQREHFHHDGHWWNLLACELLTDDWLARHAH